MQDIYGYSTRKLAEYYGKKDDDKKENSYKYYQRKLNLLELPKDIQSKIGTTSSQVSEYHALSICKLLNKDKLQKKFEKLFAEKFGVNQSTIQRYCDDLCTKIKLLFRINPHDFFENLPEKLQFYNLRVKNQFQTL